MILGEVVVGLPAGRCSGVSERPLVPNLSQHISNLTVTQSYD